MSDTPELEPGQNLPAPRPPAEPAPVERFSASPSVLANELSPERAARIVRQSSNARWVGFLTVIVVILFTAIYWFYEVGGPLGISEPRLDAELTAQQVTAVERGYNVFEANCARCHGVNGEGGIGPTLNRQDKLFAHLNENYLRTVLATGGRYVCGDAELADAGLVEPVHPARAAQLRQIDDLIAFMRATNDVTYTVRDAELGTPLKDPLTGKVKTFTGWRDPNYQPAPDATPYPACWKSEFAAPSASPGASGSPGALGRARRVARPQRPSASAGGGGGSAPISIVASGHRVHDAQRDRAAQQGLPDRLRQRGRERPAQRRDQGRRRHRASSRARSSRASRPRRTTCPPSTRARTPSTARSTPT